MMTAMILEIRRTNDYMAPWMTQMISPRLPEKLLQKIEESAPHTPVRGIHTNWRVAVYYPGNAFPAHYDLSDTVRVDAEEEGAIEVCTSSHTLLIYLSPSGSFNGGATRLFLSGKYDQVQIYSYRAKITGSKDISSLFPGYNTQNVFLFFPY